MEVHRIKNLLGELTFGEYWNLAGCTAYAAKHKKRMCASFRPVNMHEPCIRFYFDDHGEILIPLRAKAKVIGNRVITNNLDGEEVTIDFYELVPASGPFTP